jgi:3-deoxy-D-manno-octulosonate 8-phosphate phosphatase (KDO 8-P phosphatase)
VRKRFTSLGVKDIYMKSANKSTVFELFLSKYQLTPADVLYMGDDLPDYEVMQKVGFPACPADAAEEIKQLSFYTSHRNGGEGCVRDIIEQVLRLQGKWMNDFTFIW